MLGAGLQFGRSRCGEDRCCNPPKARRNNHRFQNQEHVRRLQRDAAVSQSPVIKEKNLLCSKSRAASDEAPLKPLVASGSELGASSPLCNLERFLESITPSVPAQFLSKTTMRGLRTCDVEYQPYFVLGDLWESFKEWSVYGAGVPLILNDSDCVIQYYVPYLSGIQLYGDKAKSSVHPRRLGEDSDSDYFKDSSSDGSSDCEQENGLNHSREQWSKHHRASESTLRIDRLSLRDQRSTVQEGFSSDEGEFGNPQGSLLFEYLERDPPYSREPLSDKIADLALRFPELKTLKSCDILPSSWISVAWYPIYRIPTGPTLRDLDACFLTFHHLRKHSGAQSVRDPIVTYPDGMDGVPRISLPVFGLASYKFKVSLWTPNAGYEHQLVPSLLQGAENMLTHLQVHHPDFLFFCRR